MPLTTDEMNALAIEVMTGKPSGLRGAEADAFRQKVTKEIGAMPFDQYVSLPFETAVNWADQQPSLSIAKPTEEKLVALYTQLTGKTPTPQEIAELRAKLAQDQSGRNTSTNQS